MAAAEKFETSTVANFCFSRTLQVLLASRGQRLVKLHLVRTAAQAQEAGISCCGVCSSCSRAPRRSEKLSALAGALT